MKEVYDVVGSLDPPFLCSGLYYFGSTNKIFFYNTFTSHYTSFFFLFF